MLKYLGFGWHVATDHRLLQCHISIQNLPPSCITWSQSHHNPTRAFCRQRLTPNISRHDMYSQLDHLKRLFNSAITLQPFSERKTCSQNSHYPAVISPEAHGNIIWFVSSRAINNRPFHQQPMAPPAYKYKPPSVPPSEHIMRLVGGITDKYLCMYISLYLSLSSQQHTSSGQASSISPSPDQRKIKSLGLKPPS